MIDREDLDRFAALALDCVHRPYPSHVLHLLRGDEDAKPPRALTPAFYGCFDWHSAVHGHWLLAIAAVHASAPTKARARAALARSLTDASVRGEVAYLIDRPHFERPYGLAWLLALHAALAGEPSLVPHAQTLAPLVDVAAAHLCAWLPKLSHPVRSGVHSQTAFALGLALDWARATDRPREAALFEARARALHGSDRGYALHLEPSGEDFLSPSLGAADLMRRVLDAPALASWLERALPGLREPDAFTPAIVSDPSDGRLAHLDGLNLSRAWMLRAIARALPADDPRVSAIAALGERHAEAGLAAARAAAHYAGSHWLGTFATYLLAPLSGGSVTRPSPHSK